ncbi:hypothetical protein BDC45DRAFT_569458 [Circinella umbellata]|nr:hypothetical protein BDC45DRAFT_569458 [Circinella umbellata]
MWRGSYLKYQSMLQQHKPDFQWAHKEYPELDYHQHPGSDYQQYIDPDLSQALLEWVEPPPPEPD